MNADARIGLAVDLQRGGNLDIGVMEVRELGLPVGVLEVEEERAQRGGVVERFAGNGCDLRGFDVRAGLGRRLFLAAESWWRPKPRSAASSLAALLERVARRLALCSIEAAVAILVEFLDQLPLLPH